MPTQYVAEVARLGMADDEEDFNLGSGYGRETSTQGQQSEPEEKPEEEKPQEKPEESDAPPPETGTWE
jgi:hypothetical protein